MPILLALVSGWLYGVSDYVGGRASRRAAPAAVTVVAEPTMLIAVVVGIALTADSGPTGLAIGWGMAAGVFGSLGVLGLYAALSRGNMTVVAPVTGVVAAAVPVLVGLALGERPGPLAVFGIVLAIVAVALIGGIVGAAHQHIDIRTVVLAIIVGALFGLLFVAYSRTGDDGGMWPLLAARITGIPLLAGTFIHQRRAGNAGKIERHTYLAGISIGLLVLTANGLFLVAVRDSLLSVVSVLVALYPASTILLAGVLDHERANRYQVAGMVMAVVAVVAITLGS